MTTKKNDTTENGKASAKDSEAGKTLSHNPWETMVHEGATVLFEETKGDGWFEARVIAVKPDGRIRLKWRDYPELDEFEVRSRLSLGLLCKLK